MKQTESFLILHNIRSTYNVGAIFRTADAVGVSKIYLTGYTPTPKDQWGRDRKDIAKTALGAEKSVLWECKKSVRAVIEKLKKEKVFIVALEQAENSVDYRKVKQHPKIALIVGNEVKGISKQTLSLCDVIAEIPMSGKKESLNVSVSAGVALFQLLQK